MSSPGKDNTSRNAVIAVVVVALLWWMMSSGACSPSATKNQSSSSSSSAASSSSSKHASANSSSTASVSSSNKSPAASAYDDRHVPKAPKYADERWPTNNPELLAIPESNRYYMAYNHIDQTHTVAGPVAMVYQAIDSPGMPIFVDIGIDELPSDWFTLVIWAEDLDADLERMLNAVDHGDAWLEVTGYVYLYGSHLQIQTGHGYIEYRWWTNAR